MSNQTGFFLNEPTYTRKRIAIACGRCRKRKMRCSGGEPGVWCVNCAVAKRQGRDIEDCVFNPVKKTGVPEGRDQLRPTGICAADHQVVDWKTSQLAGCEQSHVHADAFHPSQADSRFPSSYGFSSEIYSPTSRRFSNNGYIEAETAPSHSISIPAAPPLVSDSISLPPILPFSPMASSYSQTRMHHTMSFDSFKTARDAVPCPQRRRRVTDQNLPKVPELRYQVGTRRRNGHPSSSSGHTLRDPLAPKYYGGIEK
jgi:hypothetical protein